MFACSSPLTLEGYTDAVNRGLQFALIALVTMLACRRSEQRATPDSARFELAPRIRTSERPPRVRVSPCLAYEDTIVLRGRLSREAYPGPPNYKNIKQGDDAEVGYYLTLEQPICARAAYPNPDDASLISKDSVTHVQLVLDEAGYRRLESAVGRTIELRGTLFARFTGHHHAPLLLWVLEGASSSNPHKRGV